MRTEKEVFDAAILARKKAIEGRRRAAEGDRAGATMEAKYMHKFAALAWVLKRDQTELWRHLNNLEIAESKPILQRLSLLTNPPAAGRILEPKE